MRKDEQQVESAGQGGGRDWRQAAVVGSIKLSRSLGFPGDPVVKTQCFQGRDEGGFDPWSGN